jgi:hypothetical protein
LHCCVQRHGISWLPEVEGDKPNKRKFKVYPIGFFHIDIAEVRTAEGKLYLYVAVDRTSKFAFVQLVEKATTGDGPRLPGRPRGRRSSQIEIVLTDNGIQFADLPKNRSGPTAKLRGHPFERACRDPRHRASAHQAQPSMDQRPGQADEPDHQGSHRPALPLRQP